MSTDFIVLKTSGSSFEKFHRDELTTLPGLSQVPMRMKQH